MASQTPEHIKATVAGNIRSAREQREMTQRELALVLDTDAMQVSRWERAETSPRQETLAALALALGREVAWFYTDHSIGVTA